jgi:hypothetical protein
MVGVCWVAASVQLDIPPRLQWDNNNGYCGECSIQQIALYYGTYISQYRVREIIDPTQHQDIWVPENSGPVLDALRLDYVTWDSGQTAPQYQGFLVWVKSHLQQNHPVIVDVFAQDGCDEAGTNDYDHIVPVTGFTSLDTNCYHAGDTLVFNDNYSSTPVIRTFATLDDARDMKGNGNDFRFCLPRVIDYGCAVTGIKDGSGTALPVSLKVDQWNEPNISCGLAAVPLTATIQVSSLTTGTAYVLLRYNNYHNVPTNDFLTSTFDRASRFVATNSTQTFSDRFQSDATVIYRCVPEHN